MKRRKYYPFRIISLFTLVFAMPPGTGVKAQEFVWATRAGGLSDDRSRGFAVDGAGNSYVTGNFIASATFGEGETNETTLASAGSSDIFVAKYNDSGALGWATRAGGTSLDVGYGIAADGAGGVYVAGVFEGSTTFGVGEPNETTLTSVGNEDVFVAKYDSNGMLEWATRAGGTLREDGLDVSTDGVGGAYVTGFFSGSATFGVGESNESTLTATGQNDIFVAKYNNNGSLNWATHAGGASDEEGLSIAADGSGNSYITGFFGGSATFGAGESNETTLGSSGSREIFVAKYNDNGALEWAKRAGGSGFDIGNGIAANGSGNSYITGRFSSSATFGAGESNETTLASIGPFDIFVAKYNDNGALEWAKRAGGSGFDIGNGIAANGSGNSYITGLFVGSATFGVGETHETTLNAAGNDDIFVATKYSSNGALEWAVSAGGSSVDRGQGVGVDDAGSSYVTGIFQETADFDPGPGIFNLTSVSNADLFVFKLGPLNQPPVADAGPDQALECAAPTGTLVTLDGTGSTDPDDDPLTFTWTSPFGTVTGPTPTVTLPLGTHVIILTVDDSNGGTDTDEVTIIVEDTTPPVITVAADPIMLWPPNHTYHTTAAGDFVTGASDLCDGEVSASSVAITSVSSDEPEDATGDGNTLDDIVIAGNCQWVDLRAERQGGGNGRVYTITVAATDANGNAGEATFQVQAPHNKKSLAFDDGIAYSVACGTAKYAVTPGDAADVPEGFSLSAAYPNPFNPVTHLTLKVAQTQHVSIVVYDMLGRAVARLHEGIVAADAAHAFTFEAHTLPSGAYVIQAAGETFQTSRRVVLTK